MVGVTVILPVGGLPIIGQIQIQIRHPVLYFVTYRVISQYIHNTYGLTVTRYAVIVGLYSMTYAHIFPRCYYILPASGRIHFHSAEVLFDEVYVVCLS